MNEVNEQIHRLRFAAESTPIEAPELRHELLNEADNLTWQSQQYHVIVERVCEVANQHRAEKQAELDALRDLVGSKQPMTYDVYEKLKTLNVNWRVPDPRHLLELNTCPNLQQRLDSWARGLQALELLSLAEVRALNITIPENPATRKRRDAEAEAHQRLVNTRDSILASISDLRKRADARTQYNLLDGPLTESKIHDWLQRCVSAGLLGPQYLAGAKLGGFIQRLLKGEEVEREFFK